MEEEGPSPSKKRLSENPEYDDSNKKILRSTLKEFDWEKLCFICGNRKKNGNSILTRVLHGSEVIKKILDVAKLKYDFDVQNRLKLCGEFDLFSVGAGYHKKPCYHNYVSCARKLSTGSNENESLPSNHLDTNDLNSNFNYGSVDNYGNGSVNSNETNDYSDTTPVNKNYTYEDIVKSTLDIFKERLENNEIIAFPDICTEFRKILFEKWEQQCVVRSNFIKSKVLEFFSESITFYSESGYPDLVCLKRLSTSYFVRKLYSLQKESKSDDESVRNSNCAHKQLRKGNDDVFILENLEQQENIILHRAVAILRKIISNIPPTTHYPVPDKVSLNSSISFVPFKLQLFLSWLISETAFLSATVIHNNNDKNRMITLCECIIFCSRRKHATVIPPFHFGLTLQLYHKFGSKYLIDTLNEYGFCATYDELRRFLTAIAKTEILKNGNLYLPPKIISRESGGSVIHEGNDNIDIHVETLDGKNDYHAMCRVIFQNQDMNNFIKMLPIERQNDKSLNKSFNISFLKMFYYKKPSKKPEPPQLVGAKSQIQTNLLHVRYFRNTDIAWLLLRSLSRGVFNKNTDEKQIFPNWTAFNTRFGEKKRTVTVVQFAPAINAKPTDLNTVYTTLKKGQDLAKECGQTYHIHTFDQQLYAIAQLIKFNIPQEFNKLVIRLGGFHTACTFISCIGKIWGDAGLRDILVESDVYAGKTVDSMLEGKQFYRAVRGLTLCYEALITLLFENCFQWLMKNNQNDNVATTSYIEKIRDFKQKYLVGCNAEVFSSFTEDIDKLFIPTLTQFIEKGRKDFPTFQFWIDCLQSIQILLDFIRADRDFNWDLHVKTHARMLPYFFACNKQNYSRWGTLYVTEMLLRLPEEVKEDFQAGNFAINLTPGAFKGIFSDMATEMTGIKHTKSDVGIPGLTRKDSAVLRWTLNQNILGEYTSIMYTRNNIKDANSDYDNYVHEGEKHSSLHRDEEDVLKILNYMKSHMSDPFAFDKYTGLINIGHDGLVATPEISDCLLNITNNGSQHMFKFLERLEKENDKSAGFNDPIKKHDLKTFSSMHKTLIYKVNGREIRKVIKPEFVYQRALSVCEQRPNVDLKMILSVPLTNIPSSLYKPDGIRRTTPKSDLMHLLENIISDEIKIQKPPSRNFNAIVIDGMAQLQSLEITPLTTYNDIGHRIMDNIVLKLYDADEVHLVFDRYDDSGVNPKQQERFSRYGSGSHTVEIIGCRYVRDLKKILANIENKSRLTNFICKYLQQYLPTLEIMNNETKKVFVAGGIEPRKNTYVISQKYQYDDFNLSCNHIDADTRIIFHVNEIQSRHPENTQIIIESPDTDVFVLLVSHYTYFDSKPFIWFYTGKTDKRIDHRRFIPIHKLYEQIGIKKSLSLITLHALSGCDTTSSFFMIGKRKAYSGLCKLTESEIDNFIRIVDLPLPDAVMSVTKYLSQVYITDKLKNKKSLQEDNIQSINNLRYGLALIKNSTIDKLPPSEPALIQHILRVKWQVNEWSQARSSVITSLNPSQHGWILKDNVFYTNYFEGATAMDVLQKYVCSCIGKSPCNNEKICTCMSINLKCCDLCSCSEKCANKELLIENIEVDGEEEYDEIL